MRYRQVRSCRLADAGRCRAESVTAQRASQPGFDPRQTEKRFDALESQQATTDARPGLQVPRVPRSEGSADSKPLFVLRKISLIGARAIPREELVRAYQPYLGKNVSQADLAAIASAISDIYRAAGFHLSRAIVPPQDIQGGHVRLQVIEGSIAEVALKGEGADRFGVRPLLEPVLAEQPSRLPTLERQLLL
jgi:hemolysin activation/secretion protein